MPVQHVENMDQYRTLLEKPGLIVIDFSAEWCGPCKYIGPIFERMSNEEQYAGVTFVHIDVDEAEDVAAECRISAMPTFQFYKGGQKIEEMMGADQNKLVALLAKHK